MAHVHFEEEQRFSSIIWIWIATLILLLGPIALMVNSKEISSEDLSMIMLTTGLAFLPMIVILWFSNLIVKINEDGIQYKFFPAVIKWKIISKREIESFEVTPKKNLMERLQIGHKRNLINKTITMNITGTKFARIKLKDGRGLKIGTNNPDGFERALRKLTSSDNQ